MNDLPKVDGVFKHSYIAMDNLELSKVIQDDNLEKFKDFLANKTDFTINGAKHGNNKLGTLFYAVTQGAIKIIEFAQNSKEFQVNFTKPENSNHVVHQLSNYWYKNVRCELLDQIVFKDGDKLTKSLNYLIENLDLDCLSNKDCCHVLQICIDMGFVKGIDKYFKKGHCENWNACIKPCDRDIFSKRKSYSSQTSKTISILQFALMHYIGWNMKNKEQGLETIGDLNMSYYMDVMLEYFNKFPNKCQFYQEKSKLIVKYLIQKIESKDVVDPDSLKYIKFIMNHDSMAIGDVLKLKQVNFNPIFYHFKFLTDQDNLETKLDQDNLETKLDQDNLETKLDQDNSETKLDQDNSETKLDQDNLETKLDQILNITHQSPLKLMVEIENDFDIKDLFSRLSNKKKAIKLYLKHFNQLVKDGDYMDLKLQVLEAYGVSYIEEIETLKDKKDFLEKHLIMSIKYKKINYAKALIIWIHYIKEIEKHENSNEKIDINGILHCNGLLKLAIDSSNDEIIREICKLEGLHTHATDMKKGLKECFKNLPNGPDKEKAINYYQSNFPRTNSTYSAVLHTIFHLVLTYGFFLYDIISDIDLANSYWEKFNTETSNYRELEFSKTSATTNDTINYQCIRDETPESYHKAFVITCILLIPSSICILWKFGKFIVNVFKISSTDKFSWSKVLQDNIICITYQANLEPDNIKFRDELNTWKREWNFIQGIELSFETSLQLIIQLWLLSSHHHSNITESSWKEFSTNVWMGIGSIFLWVFGSGGTLLQKNLGKVFYSVLNISIGVTNLKIRLKSMFFSLDSFAVIWISNLLQLTARLMLVWLIFILGNVYIVIFLISHGIIATLLKIFFELPPWNRSVYTSGKFLIMTISSILMSILCYYNVDKNEKVLNKYENYDPRYKGSFVAYVANFVIYIIEHIVIIVVMVVFNYNECLADIDMEYLSIFLPLGCLVISSGLIAVYYLVLHNSSKFESIGPKQNWDDFNFDYEALCCCHIVRLCKSNSQSQEDSQESASEMEPIMTTNNP